MRSHLNKELKSPVFNKTTMFHQYFATNNHLNTFVLHVYEITLSQYTGLGRVAYRNKFYGDEAGTSLISTIDRNR